MAAPGGVLPAEAAGRQDGCLWLTVPGLADQVAGVRAAALAFAERHRVKRPIDVALGIGEAAANVIVHAYRDRPPGPLHLIGRVDAEFIHLLVVDEGHGLGAVSGSRGLGAGLEIMARTADGFAIGAGQPAGTVVLLAFARETASLQVGDLHGPEAR